MSCFSCYPTTLCLYVCEYCPSLRRDLSSICFCFFFETWALFLLPTIKCVRLRYYFSQNICSLFSPPRSFADLFMLISAGLVDRFQAERPIPGAPPRNNNCHGTPIIHHLVGRAACGGSYELSDWTRLPLLKGTNYWTLLGLAFSFSVYLIGNCACSSSTSVQKFRCNSGMILIYMSEV